MSEMHTWVQNIAKTLLSKLCFISYTCFPSARYFSSPLSSHSCRLINKQIIDKLAMIINGNVDERQCTARFDKVACNNLPNYVLNW